MSQTSPKPPTPSTEAAATGAGDHTSGLYQHRSRPEWGMATLVWRRDGRAAYQFQDGKLRRFAISHEHLMDAVGRPGDEAERIEHELADMAGLATARQKRLADCDGQLITLDEQVALLLEDFSGGFSDPGWLKAMRGRVGTSRAKRHRDAAIADAERLLDRAELSQLLAASRYEQIIERVKRLLASTSLVSKRDLAPLAALDLPLQRRVAAALDALLDDDADVAKAMQEWIDALAMAGRGVSWSLATAALALARPAEHVCVRAKMFIEQAKWMAPRLAMRNAPSGRQYVELRKMAVTIAEALHQRDLEPTDLLDVHDFIYHTQRPASRKRIAAMPPPPAVSQVTVKPGGEGTAVDAA